MKGMKQQQTTSIEVYETPNFVRLCTTPDF